MKKISLEIDIEKYEYNELSSDDKQIVDAAINATSRSYSVYSNFSVGAALRLENNEIVLGANQENAAYPSGLCAERTAIFAAQVQNPDEPIVALAIAARNRNGLLSEPVTPCGACRQVMLEIESRYNKPIRILLYGTKFTYIVRSVKDLLPLSFVGSDL